MPSYAAWRPGTRYAGHVEMAATGLEHNLPTDGPVLLVARHYHHLFDGVVLLASMPRPIHILVTLDWAKKQLRPMFNDTGHYNRTLASRPTQRCFTRLRTTTMARGQRTASSHSPPPGAIKAALYSDSVKLRFTLKAVCWWYFRKVILTSTHTTR